MLEVVAMPDLRNMHPHTIKIAVNYANIASDMLGIRGTNESSDKAIIFYIA